MQALSRYFLHDLHLRQVQLDELYAVRSAVQDGEVSADEALDRLSRAPHWVWTAMDPESTVRLGLDVGERTLAMAQHVVHHVSQVLTPDCAPLCVPDGFREYLTALLTHSGQWVQRPRRQAKGPLPKPRWMPLAELLDAQGVKTMRRRRLVAVKHHVVCGTQRAIEQALAPCGWQINTSFRERRNLRLRQRVAAMGRRSATPGKSEDGLGQQRALLQVYHNFV